MMVLLLHRSRTVRAARAISSVRVLFSSSGMSNQLLLLLLQPYVVLESRAPMHTCSKVFSISLPEKGGEMGHDNDGG